MTKELADKALLLKNFRQEHLKNKRWPTEKKIEAVTIYMATGSLKEAAQATQVPYGVIRNWKSGTKWWREYEAEIAAGKRVQVSNKLMKLVDKSLEVIEDRLVNGDYVWNQKTQQIIRRDVVLRDATTAANVLMTRLAAIEAVKVEEKKEEVQVNIQEQLKLLADNFARMNAGRKVAEDIEFVERVEEDADAIHDQWPEGLQEGSSPLHEQTRGGEEEDGAECCSSEDDGEGPSS